MMRDLRLPLSAFTDDEIQTLQMCAATEGQTLPDFLVSFIKRAVNLAALTEGLRLMRPPDGQEDRRSSGSSRRARSWPFAPMPPSPNRSSTRP